MRALSTIAILVALALAGCSGPADPASADDHPLRGSDFTWSPTFPELGDVVTFDAAPRSSIDGDELERITWSIEGSAADGWHPEYTFSAPGEHDVAMTVNSTEGGEYTVTKTVSVLAPAGTDADDPGTPTIHVVTDGLEASFAFTWGATADQVYWDLGDGTESNDLKPVHRYVAGTYDVTLRVAGGEHVREASTRVTVAPATDADGALLAGSDVAPRVVVGVTDSGINPYHEVYYRQNLTAHPCTYVEGYDDCDVPALHLTVGPGGGSYQERLEADGAQWDKVGAGKWFWIPRTNLIAVHCPDGGSSQGGLCILDDESSHGTGTTSNVLTEAPDALLVFNEGSSSAQLAQAPVPLDIESNSWGSLAPLYAGFVNGPTGTQVCHDSIDDPASIKFRSAGNNGPVPNMGDCWRNGHRAYSVSGGYPDGTHGTMSGSAPDFASYWCRPVASVGSVDGWGSSCGTSFAAPTAAGTAAAALLEIRREMGYTGPSTTDEVAPGLSHEAFIDAVIWGATYDPEPRDGFPNGDVTGAVTGLTPWYWWGWGWLDAQVTDQIVDCAMGRECPDTKSAEAWAFNDVRRSFASDGQAL